MTVWTDLRALDKGQKSAITASFLGWTLDAFDFFVMILTLRDISKGLGVDYGKLSYAISLTLFMRPIGAFLFGYLADKFGRRPVLMLDIVLFAALELASAAAPNLTVFLVLRAIFGIAMGGEWGVGAALVMETIPPKVRGPVSGLLQEGYAFGFLLASGCYALLLPLITWRGMFVVGAIPALLVVYIRMNVAESPSWESKSQSLGGMLRAIRVEWKLVLYTVLLMSCFNAFSHGTQDLYSSGFLGGQLHLSSRTQGLITGIGNLGAIVGGISFGAISERIGRRRAIIIAALLILPFIPLWVFSPSMIGLATGAFFVQVSVQGAWGVVPAHLNELSPPEVRGTFPGFTYQLGNAAIFLLAPLQVDLAERLGDNYALTLAITAAVVALLVAIVSGVGFEYKGRAMRAEAVG